MSGRFLPASRIPANSRREDKMPCRLHQRALEFILSLAFAQIRPDQLARSRENVSQQNSSDSANDITSHCYHYHSYMNLSVVLPLPPSCLYMNQKLFSEVLTGGTSLTALEELVGWDML